MAKTNSKVKENAKNKLPTLYHRDSKGVVRIWRVWAEGVEVVSEAGQQGGKMLTARRTCTPKNVGRTNATTAEEQAIVEARSDWQRKLDRKYSETVPSSDYELPLPMHAHTFFNKDGTLTSHAKKVVYPVHVQPKLDGVRCIAKRDASGAVVLHSRNGFPYVVPHVLKQLHKWLPEGMELDGELYVHGMALQNILSLVKRPRVESLALTYHVFDMPRVDGKSDVWKKRADNLAKRLQESANVKGLKHVIANSFEDVQDFHDRFRQRGFEGAIIRKLDGSYRYGFRTDDLLKVKAFLDAEFLVVGCEQGVGKMEGCATFVCRVDPKDPSTTFKATMKGTMAQRQQFWQEREHYIGKKLTVEFFGWTKDEIPFHPTGKVFRDEEDMP